MKTFTTKFKGQPITITEDILNELQECFNVHEILHLTAFQQAWKEYHGVELSDTPIKDVEYYANDFVWWALSEGKEYCYNLIGLVDSDGNIYDEYKELV